jgi:hypothetical protein
LSGFVEPTNIVTEVPRPEVEKALSMLNEVVPLAPRDKALVVQIEEQRVKRQETLNAANEDLVG